MRWFVYILICDKTSYYVGIAKNIKRRLLEHRDKQSFYTKQFNNIELVFQEEYNTKQQAERREKQLKGWSFAKKNALVKGDKNLLIQLSKKY